MSPAAHPGFPALDLEEVSDAIFADGMGNLVKATADEAEAAQGASHTARLVGALEALGSAAGLSRLGSLVVRGARGAAVIAVRDGLVARVRVGGASGTARVEKALAAWSPAAPPPAAPPAPAAPPEAARPDVAEADPAAVGAADLAAGLAAAAARVAAASAPWAELRGTLLRGQLSVAAALRDALKTATPEAAPAPGAEPVPAGELDGLVQRLLEGTGAVVAGDVTAGLRALEPLVSPPHPNLTARWLALHWSARAALGSGALAAARWFAKEAVILSRRLDLEARAASHWLAAAVLAAEGDHARGGAWLGEARAGFRQLGDTWGLARVGLDEARLLAARRQEAEAVEAARQAAAGDPDWDEPAVWLAARALRRGALDDALSAVRPHVGAGADRIRALVEAVRRRAVGAADAAELVERHLAGPSPEALAAVQRIAAAAPAVPVAREVLAWLHLRAGRHAEAEVILGGLVSARLSPALRSSVMLALGCVAHARGSDPAAPGPGGTTSPALDASGFLRPSSSMLGGPAAPGAVLSGALSVFAVPDLLEFLRGARRTGKLVCSTPAGIAAFRFREGRVASASSPTTPRLGELLVRERKLSPVVLRELLDRRAAAGAAAGFLGEQLVAEGLVEAEDVRAALRAQIGLAVAEILAWEQGDFVFERPEERAAGRAELPVEVDPQEVLLNALRELDEAGRA